MHADDIEEVIGHFRNNVSCKKETIERFVELIRLDNGNREFRIYDGQGKLLWGK